MGLKYQKKSEKQKKKAREHIEALFKEAESVFSKDPAMADRYVYLARKIAMKFKIRIPSVLKRRFCKFCYKYVKPGVNLRIRLSKSKVVYYCLECRHLYRLPYLKEKKAKKTENKAFKP